MTGRGGSMGPMESSSMQQGGSRLRWSALAFALSIGGIVVLRIVSEGVPPYGTDGAQYIEHIARLTALDHWRAWEGSNLWAALVAADGSFPATLHFLTLPFGALFGHSAETATFTGLFWLGLLAAAVGSVTRQLSGRAELGWLALAACFMVPAFSGMATRYYYDLPMLAMLWTGVALVVRAQAPGRAPLGVAAGVCFLLACLIKWAAIPYGLLLGFGALLLSPVGATPTHRHRGLLALGLVVPVAVGLSLYFGAVQGISSFQHQAHITVPAAQLQTGQQGPPASGIKLLLSELPARLGAHSPASLAFYPLRLVTSLLSLPLAVLLGFLSWRWWRGSRKGALGLGAMLVGWVVFHLGVVPVLDDRFLIPLVPAFVVVAALGFGELSSPLRGRLALIGGALGLLTALDVHLIHDSPLAFPVEVISSQDGPGGSSPHTVLRGLSSGGSYQARGWARADEVGVVGRRSDRRGLREAVWSVLRAEQTGVVGGAVAFGAFDERGDRFWWEYRSQLAALTSGGGATSFSGASLPCGEADQGGWDNGSPSLLVLPAGQPWGGLSACVSPSDWQEARRVEDPDGGAAVSLWRRRVSVEF